MIELYEVTARIIKYGGGCRSISVGSIINFTPSVKHARIFSLTNIFVKEKNKGSLRCPRVAMGVEGAEGNQGPERRLLAEQELIDWNVHPRPWMYIPKGGRFQC